MPAAVQADARQRAGCGASQGRVEGRRGGVAGMELAVEAYLQEAGGVERLSDGVLAGAAAEVEVAGRGVKAQADRGQGAVLQHFQARARPPAVRGSPGRLVCKQPRPNRGESHGSSFARWRAEWVPGCLP